MSASPPPPPARPPATDKFDYLFVRLRDGSQRRLLLSLRLPELEALEKSGVKELLSLAARARKALAEPWLTTEGSPS